MQGRRDSVVYLMTELQTRGQNAYVRFYNALMESGQEHLAIYLKLGLPEGDLR
jgi:hypothetical protein